jgi:hypothetical protein
MNRNKNKADKTKHMSPAKVPGMAAALFRSAEGHKVLIWYSGSFSLNPEAQISVLNFDNFQITDFALLSTGHAVRSVRIIMLGSRNTNQLVNNRHTHIYRGCN